MFIYAGIINNEERVLVIILPYFPMKFQLSLCKIRLYKLRNSQQNYAEHRTCIVHNRKQNNNTVAIGFL